MCATQVVKQAPSSSHALHDRAIMPCSKGGQGWLPHIITCITAPDAQTRNCAHAALAASEVVLLGVDKEATGEAVISRLHAILPWISRAAEKAEEAWDGMRAWCAVVALAGERMVRGGQINQVLKVMEDPFACKLPTVREHAHAAWHTLACLFGSMASTIAHAKRLALIMAPITNTVYNDKVERVRLSALRTWTSVLRMLGPHCCQVYASAVAPVLTAALADASDEVLPHSLASKSRTCSKNMSACQATAKAS